MAEERSFGSQFNTIMTLMVESHCQHRLYFEKSKMNDTDKDEHFHKLAECRQTIIDITSSWAMEYMGKLDETIAFMVDTDDELDDVGYAGITDYGRYTIEQFMTEIIDELYTMHNDVVMDIHMSKLKNEGG